MLDRQLIVGYRSLRCELGLMRLDADWMVRADDRILEFLNEEGPHPPSKIEEDGRVRFGAEYIGRRCRDYLEPYDLVRNLGNGVYAITEQGDDYLKGKLNVSELDKKEP